MKEPKHKVMAIYPNAVGFAYAVMENALSPLEVEQASLKPICNTKSLNRMKEIINDHQPKVIVLEDPEGKSSFKSLRVKGLIGKILKYAQSKELEVYQYSRWDIRFVFSAFKAHSKHQIATAIAENIPNFNLGVYEKRVYPYPEKYAAGKFDALALCITHYYLTD